LSGVVEFAGGTALTPTTITMTHPVTAIILAGGNSTRMGTDKALLRLPGGETLLEHAISVASAVTPEIKLIGPHSRFASQFGGAEPIEDILPNCGPLGGIHAGLSASNTELNLVLALDMPAVRPDLLLFFLCEAEQNSALVTIAKIEERWQPLCAVYRKRFADVAEQALRAGRFKVDATFTADNTHLITEDRLRQAGFSPALFANCNTAAEWEQFTALSRRR
jgi:molybdopterin-guanine dinucleotide biosynthesis protein A